MSTESENDLFTYQKYKYFQNKHYNNMNILSR